MTAGGIHPPWIRASGLQRNQYCLIPPKKYRLTASATSSDGANEKTLFKTSAEGTLGKGRLIQEQTAGGTNVRIAGPEGETGVKFPAPALARSTIFSISPWRFPLAPEVTESVVAVDPAAERALLGSAGDFLAPLEKLLRRMPVTRALSDATSRVFSPPASAWTSWKKVPISWASSSSIGRR